MKKHYEGLTATRGIGALCIIAYHMYVLEGYVGINHFLDRTVGVGGVFVQLFFILSSFSLMCGYAETINKNECDLEQFYKRRFIKLMPVFYTALILHLFLNSLMGVKENIANVIGTASFLFAFMPTHQESVVMAAWALGIEIIFYLLFPVFLILTKTIKNTIITLGASCVMYWTYVSYYGVGVYQEYINIIRQFIPFVCGAILYHAIPYLEGLSKKKRRISLGVNYLALTIMFVLWDNGLNGLIVVLLSFCLLIINQIGIKDVLINNIFFRSLGKVSYELYLFHMIVYRVLYYLEVNNTIQAYILIPELQYIVFFLVELMLTLCMCCLFNGVRSTIQNHVRRKKGKALL